MTKHGFSHTSAQITSRLEALIGREEVAEEYVRFRVMLLAAQTGVYDELTRSASPPDGESAEVSAMEERADVGDDPALGPADVTFQPALLEKLLDGFRSALSVDDGNGEFLARLSHATGEVPGTLPRLARDAALAHNEDVLEALWYGWDTPAEAVLFFGRCLAAPFVTGAVRSLRQRGARRPNPFGMCPWCGSPPGLARLSGGEGNRVLCCSLCGETWSHGLLQCPTCRDEKDQARLWAEPEDACFVQACDNCRTYLKTVDERKLAQGETAIPLVWHTATVHLDLIAQREGYRRAFPYAALT